jgi:hypothetical protein
VPALRADLRESFTGFTPKRLNNGQLLLIDFDFSRDCCEEIACGVYNNSKGDKWDMINDLKAGTFT